MKPYKIKIKHDKKSEYLGLLREVGRVRKIYVEVSDDTFNNLRALSSRYGCRAAAIDSALRLLLQAATDPYRLAEHNAMKKAGWLK